MVTFGTELVVMGGKTNGSFSSAFYQLSAENGKLKWEKMKPELKFPRSKFVAMTIPDHLVGISQQYVENLDITTLEIPTLVRQIRTDLEDGAENLDTTTLEIPTITII